MKIIINHLIQDINIKAFLNILYHVLKMISQSNEGNV